MPDPTNPTRNEAVAAHEERPERIGWAAPVREKPGEPSATARELPEPSAPGPRPTHDEANDDRLVAAGPRLPLIPGYAVERLIGRGAMGVVYRATHAATGRAVALKLTNPGPGDDFVRDRFLREVRALAAIKHPNVVPVYDAGDWHGFSYCTMEYVTGGTLHQHLKRIRADTRAAVALMAKVARAVEALHAAGLLHRDLKPLNILLGPGDEPMVADFGLARWTDQESDLTQTGVPIGTRQYMSPEQTLGKKGEYTPACDVWALGVTLYELLTGDRPFNDDWVADVYHRIRTAPAPPIRAHVTELPEPLEAVVARCLEKTPTSRYPTAAALADDLERWLRGEPVSVRSVASVDVPDTRPPRLQRKVVAGALAIAALAAGLAGALHDRTPQANANTPANSTVQKPLAGRLAGGEKVQLTNAKGQPLVAVVGEPDHEPVMGVAEGYATFRHEGAGIGSLYDGPLDFPYKVEADVGTNYATNKMAGLYVGRKEWVGAAFKHESFVWAGIRATTDAKRPGELFAQHTVEAYWWARHEDGSRLTVHDRTLAPWVRKEDKGTLRFSRVVVEVRPDRLSATIDGQPCDPLPASAPQLRPGSNRGLLEAIRETTRPLFPGYEFALPVFGSGIGVFCSGGECVLRELTVSRLAK